MRTLPLNLLIVTHDRTLRESLAKPLRNHFDFETVVIGESVQLALERCSDHPTDIILFDFNENATASLNDIQALRSHLPRTPIVVLVNPEDVGYVGKLTESGASGWVLKGTSRDRLANALRLGKYRGTITGVYPPEL
jgi:DNA-binding NarL/FixJ family response regulator